MDTLRYTGSTGHTVEFGLSKIIRTGDGDPLRSRSWVRTLGLRSLTNVGRRSSEVSIPVVADIGEVDRMRHIFDLDMSANSPGTLSCGGWTQRALVTASTCDVLRPSIADLTLTVALLDGAWRKPVTQSFNPRVEDSDYGYLDLPYDLPYDLAPVEAATHVQGPEWLPSPIELVVYGYASNPKVEIGGNMYAVDCTVPDGGYMVIDGLNHEVTVVDAYGDRTSFLHAAHLGTGEGSGEYVFERIKPGSQPLSWSNDFGFDLTYYLEEGELPCLSS